MAIDLNELLIAELASGSARRTTDADLAVSRQRDGAAFDMRALGASIAGSLLAADDPSQFAGLNAGVRIPTTLDHPNTVVVPKA